VLIVEADRPEPLDVLRLSLAAEIARLVGGASHFAKASALEGGALR
jgi:hypothetical protein